MMRQIIQIIFINKIINYKIIYLILILIFFIPSPYAVEISLTQPVGAYVNTLGVFQVMPLVVSASGFVEVASALMTLETSPFLVTGTEVLHPDFQARIDQNGSTVHVTLDRISSQYLSMEEELVKFRLELDLVKARDTYGFGLFTLQDVMIKNNNGSRVKNVGLHPGSWFIGTDAPSMVTIRLVSGEDRLPVPRAQVITLGLAGGPGIGAGKWELTNNHGETQILYPPEQGYLLTAPDGEIHEKPNLDVRFILRIEPAENTPVAFEPFETTAPLHFAQIEGYQFQPIEIAVPVKSAIRKWTLYP
ncbi:MAG: hypothetical protein ACE15F_22015 [bacterium]